MADQTIQVGGLAQGVPVAFVAAAAPRAPQEKARPSRSAEAPPQARPAGPDAAAGSSPVAALEQLNSHLQSTGTELKVQVDEGTGHTFFRIVQQNTGEVLLQVPSAELLAMARNLRSLDKQKGASGVLLDKEG